MTETIEERAKKASEGYSDEGYEAGLYMGYKVGATEQKAIDIDKACDWLTKNDCEFTAMALRKAMEE